MLHTKRDGRIDGWMDEWTKGRMDECIPITTTPQECAQCRTCHPKSKNPQDTVEDEPLLLLMVFNFVRKQTLQRATNGMVHTSFASLHMSLQKKVPGTSVITKRFVGIAFSSVLHRNANNLPTYGPTFADRPFKTQQQITSVRNKTGGGNSPRFFPAFRRRTEFLLRVANFHKIKHILDTCGMS